MLVYIDHRESRPVDLVRRGMQHGLRLEISKQEGLVLLTRLSLAGCCLTPEVTGALQQKADEYNVSQAPECGSLLPL